MFDDLWSNFATDERRLANQETYHDAFRNIQRSYLRAGQPAEALVQAERARSRALELLLVKQRVHAAEASNSTGRAMASPMLNIDALCGFALRQRTALVVYSQLGVNFVAAWVLSSMGSLSTYKPIQLPQEDKEDALTELVELTRRSLGAQARHAGPCLSPLPTTASEGSLPPSTVDETRLKRLLVFSSDSAAATQPIDARFSQSLRRCHQLLIEPLTAALAGEPRLLILPDRELYALPWAALVDDDGRANVVVLAG